ncbi:MAG: putative Ig domain-containing protein [Pirellulales bacterium]
MRFGFFGDKKTRRTSSRHARRHSAFRSIEKLEDRRMLINDAPNLVAPAEVTGSPGIELVVPLTVSDTAGETPTAELFVFLDPDEAPAGATIDNATRTLRWMIPANQPLTPPVRIVAIVTDKPADGFPALADAEEIIVNLVPANQPPVNTVPGAQTVAEDTDLVLSTANTNRISIADPDAAAANVQVTLTAANGDLTLSTITGLTFTAGDGTDDATMTFTGTIAAINTALDGLRFSPAANFNGAATLTITTNDQGNTGGGGPQTATNMVTINVTPVADTPSVTQATTQEDIPTTSGLVVTPNPVDAATVTHVKITGITNGMLFLNNGTTPVNNNDFVPIADAQAGFRFTPAANFAGTVTLQIQASTSATDAGLGGDLVPAIITIVPANDAPNLADVPDQTVERGVALTLTATATDIDAGDMLTFILDPDQPSFGATINPTTGAFSWNPPATQPIGPTTFRILVVDNGTPTLADSETFTVTVTAVNQAPVIAPIQNQTIAEGSELTVTVTATDPDVEDDVTYSLATGEFPAGATINPDTGVLSWTPAENQAGTHSITVVATDNGTPVMNHSLTFMVTVSEVNQAPVLTPVGNRTATVGTPLTFTAVATDADDPVNTVVYSLGAGAPTGASINPTTGVFTWTPGATGMFMITVIATDNGDPALTDEEVITITVAAANQAPVITAIPDQTGTVGNAITFTATATDPDGDELIFSLDNRAPAGATINPQTGVFTWTPGAATTVTFGVVVTDDGTPAEDVVEDVTITVT